MTVSAINRPFASDLITGLMLPDGIFVTMLGKQLVNLQLDNVGASAVSGVNIYVEGVSNPGIGLTAGTRYLYLLKEHACHVFQWEADFSGCPSGTHYISFIVEDSAGVKTRLIKKIFVLEVQFDAATRTFHARTPEGVLSTHFIDLIKPRRRCGRTASHNCCCDCCGDEDAQRNDLLRDRIADHSDDKSLRGLGRVSYSINHFADLFKGHDASFEFCPPGYLPHRVEMTWTPTPAYPGRYSDLPFQDPWWKVLLCVLAALLLIAAAIVEAVDGSGSVTVGGGTDDTGSPTPDCCGVRAGGGGSSYVAAGLVAAAAAVATVAGLSDERDPMRRGQDATPPGEGEVTLKEFLSVELGYPEPIRLGKSFTVNAKWKYRRVTDETIYEAEASDSNQNTHVLSSYEIHAPEYAYTYTEEKDWIVRAKFEGPEGRRFVGNQLFVQCFLVGPRGQWRRFVLQDDGLYPDDKPDGVYSGRYLFRGEEEGLWRYFVIAQDVNHAKPDMRPEEAAKIIGGMVLTQQLVISFGEDECPLVPDGHVQVV